MTVEASSTMMEFLRCWKITLVVSAAWVIASVILQVWNPL